MKNMSNQAQDNYSASPEPCQKNFCIKCKLELPEGAVYCPACGRKQARDQRKALKRPNGTGTVYRQPGRRRRPWVAAKNKIILGYFETKTEALEALQREIGRPVSDRYNMTFEEVYKSWSNEHFRTVTDGTRKCYETAYRFFEPLYKTKFRDLRVADFQEAIWRKKAKTSTLKTYKVLLVQMSEWALKNEIIQTNFASMIELPKIEKSEKKIFTKDEIQKIEADGSDEAKITLMMVYTGMRIGEIFSLLAADVFEDYCIGGEKTDAGKNRIIPIPPVARPYFREFKARATGPTLLSSLRYASDVSFRNRHYADMLKRLGIEYRPPHSCRHTYATMASAAGMPPEILQRILGHASFQTTADIYVHTDQQALIDAAEHIF